MAMRKVIFFIIEFFWLCISIAFGQGQENPVIPQISQHLLDAAALTDQLPDAAPGSPTKTQIKQSIDTARSLVSQFKTYVPEPPMPMPMGIPDFAANGQPTLDGAGPDSVVRLPMGSVTSICGPQPVVLKTLGVAGELDVCSELHVQTLLVYPSGMLNLKPGARIVIRDIPIDLEADPEQWGNGVLILGRVRATGTPKTSVARISNVAALASTITLVDQTPADWKVGDELILPRTRQNIPFHPGIAPDPDLAKWKPYYAESERVTIAGIDGVTITLAVPTKYPHTGAVDKDGAQVTWVPIANVTRDITIDSENAADTMRRGHVVFSQRADVNIAGVSFKNLGRTTIYNLHSTLKDSQDVVTQIGTNQVGRYPVHMHHLIGPEGGVDGGEYQAVMKNCVIDGGDVQHPHKWGLTVHRSGWCHFDDLVVYNVAGSLIAEEDGVERNNVYDNIYACRSYSRTRFKNPDGTWVGPERELPGKPTVNSDERGTASHGFWFGRALEVTVNNSIVCDLNPGATSAAINWNPDGSGSAYWVSPSEHNRSPNVPIERGQDQALWTKYTMETPIKRQITINGGETFAGDAHSTLTGLQESGHVGIVNGHTTWHTKAGWGDYWMELHLKNTKVYGDHERTVPESIGYANSRHESVYTNHLVHNMAVGMHIRVGRGARNFVSEDFESASVTDVVLAPVPPRDDSVLVTIRRPNFYPSAVLYTTGWKAGTPNKPPKRYVIWGNSSNEMFRTDLLWKPHIVRIEQWGEKTYRVYPAFAGPDFVIPITPYTTSLGIAGMTHKTAFETKGVAIFGSVASCNTTLTQTVQAFFCEE